MWLRRHTRALRDVPVRELLRMTQGIDFKIYFVMLRTDEKRRVSKPAERSRSLQPFQSPLVGVGGDVGQGGVHGILHTVEKHGALASVQR